jgi:hypothetical protein
MHHSFRLAGTPSSLPIYLDRKEYDALDNAKSFVLSTTARPLSPSGDTKLA